MNSEEVLIKLTTVEAAFQSGDNTDCFASETSFSVLLTFFLLILVMLNYIVSSLFDY